MHFTRDQRDAWHASTRDSPFNRWLRARVTDARSGLDLNALHSVAREFGIDADAYAHLNPGQQRMNIGNRLRKVVPPSTYASGEQDSVRSLTLAPEPTPRPPVVQPVGPDLSESATDSLMQLYGAVIDELRRRGVVRTGNAPLGDYAESVRARLRLDVGEQLCVGP